MGTSINSNLLRIKPVLLRISHEISGVWAIGKSIFRSAHIKDASSRKSSNNVSLSSNYRPEIDGLRALAVIAVIINHFNKDLLPSGFLGVDIFFVISGYVITSSLANRQHESLSDFLLGFFARRIKRLMPALVICVGITSLVGFLFIPPLTSEFVDSWKAGVAALFGSSNLYLFWQSTDYFAASTELNLFTQTWSLGVEEQFYLVFPLLLWFSGFSRHNSNGKRNLIFLMMLLSIASFFAYFWLKQINPPAVFFLMPARFWELATGCLTFLVLQTKTPISKIIRWIKPLPITALLIALLFAPHVVIYKSTPVLVVLTSLLIITLNSKTATYRAFTWRPFVFIGLISYSLYLWHWSVLAISRWTIGIYWWAVPIQIVLILALAVISHKFIEQPFRYASWSSSRGLTIGYGLSASFVCAGLLVGLGNPFRNTLYIGEPVSFTQSTWWRDEHGNYIERCQAEKNYTSDLLSKCILNGNASNGRHTIYIFGDSHARNYLKGVEKAFEYHNIRYMTMGLGCAYMPEKAIPVWLNQMTRCGDYVKRVKDFVKNNIQDGDAVLVGQGWWHGTDPGYEANIFELASYAQSRRAWFVLLSDVPGIKQNPLLCIKQRWRPEVPQNCVKSISEVKNEQKNLNTIGSKLESKFQNAFYLDIRKYLCIDQVCSLYKDNLPLYHDTDHMTDNASKMLAPYIRSQLSFLSATPRSLSLRDP